MRILAALLALLTFPALAQSPGTLNLLGPSTTPGAPQITSVTQLNGPINTAFGFKADAASPVFTGTASFTSPGGLGNNFHLFLNGPTTSARKIQWQSAGVGRWDLGVTNAGEAGSNAGSDFLLQRRTDAGAIIDTPLTLNRATGLFTLTGSIFENPAPIVLTGAITVAQQPFSSFPTYSGTPAFAGTYQYHSFITNDSVQYTADSNAIAGSYNLRLDTGFTGSRIGLDSSINVRGQGGATAGSIIALRGDMNGNTPQGGTAPTPAGALGQIWAGLLNASLAPAATNYALYNGLEIDMNGQGTTLRKHGLQISLGPADVNRGAVFDAAFAMGNSEVSAGSWKHGLLLGEDSSQWPFASDSSLIKALMGQNDVTKPAVAAYGVDFLDVTFGTAFLRSNGLSIDGSGNEQIGTGYLQPVTAGLTIDTKGAVGNTANGAGMIVTGGSGWAGGEVLTDPYGGRYKVATVAAGVITALTVYRQPVFPTTTTPSNPVTLGLRSGTDSVAPTINISWNTTGNTLSLQPTGGALKVGSTLMTANGGIATALSSIGPTGSHTTVQEWLTVTNAAGAIRYIPAF
jgi:hypothetical protein